MVFSALGFLAFSKLNFQNLWFEKSKAKSFPTNHFFVYPEVLQSGFGVNILFLVWRIFGKLPADFSANFSSDFLLELLSLVSPRLQGPQKIHAQNSRPKLSTFLSNFTLLNPKCSHADFLLTRATKICI